MCKVRLRLRNNSIPELARKTETKEISFNDCDIAVADEIVDDSASVVDHNLIVNQGIADEIVCDSTHIIDQNIQNHSYNIDEAETKRSHQCKQDSFSFNFDVQEVSEESNDALINHADTENKKEIKTVDQAVQ